jgi:ribosomal protein S18 acetylase RimI-like enzyme
MQYTVWYLEINAREESRAKRQPRLEFQVIEAEIPAPEFQRFWYTAIGGDWHWTERLTWTLEQWREWCERPELRLFVAYMRGTPAGCFNLERQVDEIRGAEIEIKYFGLLPAFTGKGLGSSLLTECLEIAWASGAKRVHLNTCSLDHPAALKNYQARGFKIYKTEIKHEELAECPPGPWPGAH